MLCGSGPVHVKDAQQEGAANKDVWHAKGSGGGAGPRKPSTAEGTAGHAEGRQCNARQNGSMARPPAGFAGQIHNSSASVTYWHVGQKLRKEDLPYPRPNTWLEEAIAVFTMLMFFGWVVFRLFHAALPVMTFTRPAYYQLLSPAGLHGCCLSCCWPPSSAAWSTAAGCAPACSRFSWPPTWHHLARCACLVGASVQFFPQHLA